VEAVTPLQRRLTPQERLQQAFVLDCQLHGHTTADVMRFAEAMSELDELDVSRPLDPSIISPAVQPQGIWARILRRRG
jgi:hypothetical protein